VAHGPVKITCRIRAHPLGWQDGARILPRTYLARISFTKTVRGFFAVTQRAERLDIRFKVLIFFEKT